MTLLTLRALAAALALLMVAPATTTAADAVVMAPATPGAVRFSVTVPEPRRVRLDEADGLTRLDLDGYGTESAVPGGPGLPVRVVSVAVPPLGEVAVRAVTSENQTEAGLLLAPAPTRDADGRVVLRRDLGAYGAAGVATPVGARLIGVGWMRDQRVARIAIEPAAYEPAARRYTLARRVDVEVRVRPTGSLAPRPARDRLEESFYRDALLNYEQGRDWRRPEAATLAAAARRMGLAPTEANGIATPPDTSVFVGRGWVGFSIDRAGFYAVNYSRLRTTALFGNDSCAFDSLRLFTWPGRPVLPEASFCDSCDYREVALGVIDSRGDGRFSDNNDTFYFFAQGASGWANDYDSSAPDTVFINHPYELRNSYFLTIATPESPVGGAPRRIATRSVAPTGAGITVQTVTERIHLEQDIEYWPDATALGSTLAWEKWFWRSLRGGDQFNIPFTLPFADTTQPARIRLRQWGLTDNSVFGGCSQNPRDHLLDVTINGLPLARRAWTGFTAFRGGGMTIDTAGTFLRLSAVNEVRLSLPVVSVPSCPTRIDRQALAWMSVTYQRRLIPDADRFDFRSEPVAGTFRYDIGPFVAAVAPRAFDVTDPLQPVEMVGASFASNRLVLEDAQGGQRRYVVLPDSVLTRGVVAASIIRDAPFTSLQNLRSSTRRADYLVIYYDGFRQAADSLVAWRRFHLPLVGESTPYDVEAIPVSALYDQFSGGRTDPGAIRNFLRSAYFNWSERPRFVTFLGDASYDYKDITGRAAAGQPGSLVPTYENLFDNSFIVQRMFATDDWLLNVDDAGVLIPDFFGGRLPATDAAGALSVVRDKVLLYERTAPFGEYRNRLMLIADDDAQGDNCDPLGWEHVRQTSLLDTSSVAPHVDRDYVYMHTYESGPGATKPGARAAIKQTINSGVSMFNYVGHGSPFKISDESVFIDSDAGTLSNGARLPVFVAASCDVGKFNDPTVQSLGERMVMTPSGGAVAVVSSTELAFSSDNSQLNQFLYQQIFLRDTLVVGPQTLPGSGQYHVPLSAALLAAKERAPGTSPTNNAKYQVMGDAATVLNLPRLWADLALTTTAGVPVTELQRGQTIQFRGTVLDRPGGVPVPFDGVASLFIEDSAPLDNTGRNPFSGCISAFYDIDYRYRAGPMYRGDVTVTGGVFEGRFVVPLDAIGGGYGKVRAYFSGRESGGRFDLDGVGSLRAQISPGVAPAGDVEGPRINLGFVGGATSVRPDATLRIDLFDPSGIMTTGHSLQNSIVVTVDDNTTNRVDVTSSFRYAADSYQAGTASFQLPSLSPGPHRIRVTAADNLATGITAARHRSSATLDFEVVDVPPLNVSRAYLFPNPVATAGPGAGGTFIVDAPGDSVNTLIRIYTVTGRLVRTLREFGSQGQVQIPWDGRDAEGTPLANGTYLFKVHVNVREADGASSARQRAISEGRFVIVNP